MNVRSFFSLLLIIPILAGSVAFTQNAPRAVSPQVEGAATNTDMAIQGTNWVPQKIANFKSWVAYGWGIYTQASNAGTRWVHMPLTYMTYFVGSPLKVQYLEFCAVSTNGAATKPVQMDVWNNTTYLGAQAIAWPADNSTHCIGRTWATPTWYQSIGISVKLSYANTTDAITLYKAWLKVVP